MLRAIDPRRSTPEGAYRLPWRIDRDRAPQYALTNEGDETLDAVRCESRALGAMGFPARFGRVFPGATIEVDARPLFPDNVAITICWYRPDGTPYVWTFSG